MNTSRTESTGSGHTAVIGVVATRAAATRAVADLRAAGFADDQIGVVARDDRDGATAKGRSGLQNDPTYTKWEEVSGVGAAIGGTTGLGLGLAVAGGVIPAIGPVITGGVLVALLASAGAGATTGTLIGALVGLGVPEDEAARFQNELEAGRVLVTVQYDGDRAAKALEVLRRHGAPGGASPVGTYGTGVAATPY